MAHARCKVGDVTSHGATVRDGTTYTLGYLDNSIRGKVALFRALSHCLNRPHAAVSLQADAILIEIFARSLLSSCKQRTHHDTRRSHRECFHYVTRAPNAPVCDYRNAKHSGQSAGVINGRASRAPGCAYLLSSTDRARSHSHTQTIRACLYEVKRLMSCYNVSSNNLDIGEGGFNV